MNERTPFWYWSWDPAFPKKRRVLIHQIEAWILGGAMQNLITSFGGQIPVGSTEAQLHAVMEFAKANWDFRHGGERYELGNDAPYTREVIRSIADAARQLGLRGETPFNRVSGDYLTVMEVGAAWTCGVRLKKALLVAQNGGTLMVLGGERPLGVAELSWAATQRLSSTTEFGIALSILGRELGLSENRNIEGGRYRLLSGMTSSVEGKQITTKMLYVPKVGSSRPNTESTLTKLAECFSTPQHVVLVTNPIYVPYQGTVAIRLLGVQRGWSVDAVSTPFDLLGDFAPLPLPAGNQDRY